MSNFETWYEKDLKSYMEDSKFTVKRMQEIVVSCRDVLKRPDDINLVRAEANLKAAQKALELKKAGTK